MAQRTVSLTKDALKAFEICLAEAEAKGGVFLRERIAVEAIQLFWFSVPDAQFCNIVRGTKNDPDRPGNTLYDFEEGSFRGSYSACPDEVTILSMQFSEAFSEALAVAERAA